MEKISTDIVKEYLQKGGSAVLDIAREVYEDRAD
ncbi:hypothetical protein M2454_000107 [Aequitasia blattaphilus]